jgi:hypothetical protein
VKNSFAEHLSNFINKVVTIYVEGGLKSGFSGFVLDVNIDCVTMLSINNFNFWTSRNMEELFITKTIIVIPIDKITTVVSYTSQNTSIPMQDGLQNENLIQANTTNKSSSQLIIGLLAFLIFKILKS